jgi:hypothetical protein
MIHYLQYRPAFFSGFDNDSEGDVANVEQLLKLDFVARFTEKPEFYRFSRSTKITSPQHSGLLCTLMVEYKEGYEWWVVAYLWPERWKDVEALPNWEQKAKLSS